MIVASPAPVAPRIVSERHVSLPLETFAEEFCATRDSGGLMIVGGGGAGKTTALSHLAAVLPNAEEIIFLDEPTLESAIEEMQRALVVFTSCEGAAPANVRRIELAPWSRDELIEYLLAVHPARCRSVMSRLSLPTGQLGECPLFWKTVLDALADGERLGDLEQAIETCLEQVVCDPELHEVARWYCLAHILQLQDELVLEHKLQLGLTRQALLFVRSDRVIKRAALEQASRGLQSSRSPELLAARWPVDLVDEVALELSLASEVTNVLRQSLNGSDQRLYAMAASLLVRIDPQWQPLKRLHSQGLQGAYLQGVNWQNCDLSTFGLRNVDFTGAHLQQANLSGVAVNRSVLFQCKLNGARLPSAMIVESSLEEADLSDANCQKASFQGVCLHEVTACRANFDAAKFVGSDCGSANFVQARFRGAVFDEVELSDADFSDADLSRARLNGADLRTAELSGSCLQRAKLQQVNFENVEWVALDGTGADLDGAMCTGSTLRSAILREAVLRKAELGEIHWEEADLREADLRGATFHLGSSRSGLLLTPIASEGSRTGFYTDESLEQHFQAPEEIRKANLRGSDLRGAKVEGVDFYLVDLRGALLEPEQLAQAQRTGAILDRE